MHACAFTSVSVSMRVHARVEVASFQRPVRPVLDGQRERLGPRLVEVEPRRRDARVGDERLHRPQVGLDRRCHA
eukprot:3806477-Pleurochrysis_carterae.AAC.2